ncbi:deoxyribose-phosphate aldolase [Paenibacillus hodogayensis]|uniref:Deoxyribose-phosphate aldolase n=1 Tax=Paenibacillus hodogayensis TaxID=279208 RepID=A0ABV5VQP0_9BACL
MKEISAGGVVYRVNEGHTQIQLIMDRYGKITLPKGKMEPGETVEQTALREIREETGIDGRIVSVLERVDYRYEHPKLGHVDKEVHYYLVEATGGELKAQVEEINGVEWLEPHEAWARQKQAGYDNNDSVLKRALEALHIVTDADKEASADSRRVAAYIDHTLLKADATPEAIGRLCDEAREYGFYSVCVGSAWVPLCIRRLAGSGVRVSAVVGFPLGNSLSEAKALEAAHAADHGASDIDMVLAVGALLAGDEAYVREDIRKVVEAVKGRAIVKVILETGYLNEDQKRTACRLAEEAGAHFVKTSTGFGPGGATVEDVKLMRAAVSPSVEVKASGGVRDWATAQAMIAAGATRLGTSSGVAIVGGANAGTASGGY